MADKLRRASSTGVANVATVSTVRAPGATTLSVDTGGLLNWSTTTSTDFNTYTLVNGVKTNICSWTGRADADNDRITELELTNGTDVGNAIDDIVICVETAAWVNDVIDTLSTIFDSTGTLKSNSISSSAIINSAISAVKIATSAVTEEKIATSAVTTDKIAATAVTTAKMDADARKQTLDIDGSTTVVFSTASSQPAAQSGKTIIWFAPSS